MLPRAKGHIYETGGGLGKSSLRYFHTDAPLGVFARSPSSRKISSNINPRVCVCYLAYPGIVYVRSRTLVYYSPLSRVCCIRFFVALSQHVVSLTFVIRSLAFVGLYGGMYPANTQEHVTTIRLKVVRRLAHVTININTAVRVITITMGVGGTS